MTFSSAFQAFLWIVAVVGTHGGTIPAPTHCPNTLTSTVNVVPAISIITLPVGAVYFTAAFCGVACNDIGAAYYGWNGTVLSCTCYTLWNGMPSPLARPVATTAYGLSASCYNTLADVPSIVTGICNTLTPELAPAAISAQDCATKCKDYTYYQFGFDGSCSCNQVFNQGDCPAGVSPVTKGSILFNGVPPPVDCSSILTSTINEVIDSSSTAIPGLFNNAAMCGSSCLDGGYAFFGWNATLLSCTCYTVWNGQPSPLTNPIATTAYGLTSTCYNPVAGVSVIVTGLCNLLPGDLTPTATSAATCSLACTGYTYYQYGADGSCKCNSLFNQGPCPTGVAPVTKGSITPRAPPSPPPPPSPSPPPPAPFPITVYQKSYDARNGKSEFYICNKGPGQVTNLQLSCPTYFTSPSGVNSQCVYGCLFPLAASARIPQDCPCFSFQSVAGNVTSGVISGNPFIISTAQYLPPNTLIQVIFTQDKVNLPYPGSPSDVVPFTNWFADVSLVPTSGQCVQNITFTLTGFSQAFELNGIQANGSLKAGTFLCPKTKPFRVSFKSFPTAITWTLASWSYK